MSILTDLSISPYFDDFDETKNYNKILFRPSVAVQVRELNQLQSILQKQIERFGDNIFKSGTIIDGCHISFHDDLAYVKIKDLQSDGTQVDVTDYDRLYIKNSANLQAFVVTTSSGYETKAPDLNTLYVKYINSGNDYATSTFAAGQTLTVFDKNDSVFNVTVGAGSAGFTDVDNVVFLSSLAIQNSSGGTTFSNNAFSVNRTIYNGSSARATITSVDTTTDPRYLILNIKPRTQDLTTADSTLWSFDAGDSITETLNPTQAASIVEVIGAGAQAKIAVDSVGQIRSVSMTARGSGYYVNPYVTVSTKTATNTQVNALSLSPQTFLGRIVVANSVTTPIGSSYGVTVDEGVIYQKGYFSGVAKQFAVVEKYNNLPDNKALGFNTQEDIITFRDDESLLDNSLGSPNQTAPGANRLKLTPTVTVLTSQEAENNEEFLPILSFSNGRPYKQNRQTQYNIIGDELARRSYEESGNYVLNKFLMNTKSITTSNVESTSQFYVVVDPGVAYINGYRVETSGNYYLNVNKGITTQTVQNATVSLDYGKYFLVNELGGSFSSSTGDQIYLYDTAREFLTSSSGAVPSSSGTQIGKARVRCVQYESGIPGTPNCIYRVYVFNVKIEAGKNVDNVRSLYYSDLTTGVADIVTNIDATTGETVATLYDNRQKSMSFYAGKNALKNANNISYTYRTIDTTVSANTLGFITKSLGTAGETFPYSLSMNTLEKFDLIVVPQANVGLVSNVSGHVTTSLLSKIVSGTGTSFTSDLDAGDYIQIANNISNMTGRIDSISNNTYLTLAANATVAFATANTKLYFPKNVPVSLNRTSRTGTVDNTGAILSVYLGGPITATTNMTITHNVRASNVSPVVKIVNRNLFVRLCLSNNQNSNTGPWELGVSDAFRLKGVYVGSNGTFTPTQGTDATNDFYIDNNQRKSFYSHSKLVLKPKSTRSLTTATWLLVKFDAFTSVAEGLKSISSYPINDTLNLSDSAATINTLEIPEFYDSHGNYYDLRDQFDFRPITVNTANLVFDASNTTITLNPSEPNGNNKFTIDDKKFPVPGTDLSCTLEYYQPRIDKVVVTSSGDIVTVTGRPESTVPPQAPVSSIVIGDVYIPPYPSLPKQMSNSAVSFADVKMARGKFINKRIAKYRVKTPITDQQISLSQPRNYKMEDIAVLERRINDLEYYTALSLVENQTKSRIIPSSVDESMDRFKFGFFVDSFDNYAYAETSDPEYNATITNGFLGASGSSTVLQFEPNSANLQSVACVSGDVLTLPYEEFTVAQQSAATGTIVSVTDNVVQTTLAVVQSNRNTSISSTGGAYEESEFEFSSSGGAVEMYFNNRDWCTYTVYYSDTPNFSTDGLTAFNVSYRALNNYEILDNAKTGELGNVYQSLVEESMYGVTAINGSGLLSWTHNPLFGRYVKIRTTKYKKRNPYVSGFSYRLFYPSDTSLVPASTNICTPETFGYLGQVQLLYPNEFTIHSTLQSIGAGFNSYGIDDSMNLVTYVADSQGFSIGITGLKPNTNHKFYFDVNEADGSARDESSRCMQFGKVMGDTLVSDPYGKLSFMYYYDAGVSEATSDFLLANRLLALSVGRKLFSVEDINRNSRATGVIEIKSAYNSVSNFGPNGSSPDTSSTLPLYDSASLSDSYKPSKV
jgi:hypothetical protein